MLEPTTKLLNKYSPEYTCLLVGAKTLLDNGWLRGAGRQRANTDAGRRRCCSVTTRTTIPDNLPVVGAKGGPGGKPGCGSLPDVAKNWPVRHLVTNTGFGTGMDCVPTPASAFPAWANYLPSPARCPNRRASATCRRSCAGADPVSGGAALRRALYAPDGTPLWPGCRRRRRRGAEGSRPDAGYRAVHRAPPAQMQPTPLPPIPLPQEAAPSP